MDAIDRYKIEESIEDVIIILDSAPIYRNLVPETNDVQLTNRVPIAHLAIERGLKALIAEADGPKKDIHDLDKLYRDLKECDQESADYLATAFEDAVNFFGYNVNIKGFKQFRSLDNYLSKVGNKKAFGVLRYWAIGETGEGESPISYISLPIHRELLCALLCLFLSSRRETVSERVEQEVAYAMFEERQIHYNTDDTSKKQTICWYRDWLFRDHTTRRGALKEAVCQNFVIKDDDEFVSQTLRDAYTDLHQSKDPAVQHFVRTLTYLPKGSQLPNSDAAPEVQWLNQDQTRGVVRTPAGTRLGVIEKYSDGAWGIIPRKDGLVQASDIAEAMADAKHYLVNRLTRQVTVNVNGKLKQLRIVSQRDFFPRPVWTQDTECSAETYELEFWNSEHALQPGEAISIELRPKRGPGYASVLEGTVITVAEQKVSLLGQRSSLREKPIYRQNTAEQIDEDS